VPTAFSIKVQGCVVDGTRAARVCRGCGSRDTGSKGVQGCGGRETYRGTFELLHQLPILLLQLLIQVLNLLLLGLQLLLQLLTQFHQENQHLKEKDFHRATHKAMDKSGRLEVAGIIRCSLGQLLAANLIFLHCSADG